MTKLNLIEGVASDVGISKTDAGKAIESFMNQVKCSLKSGEDVTLVGFGTFKVKNRAARTGRNPFTGESIPVPAKRAVIFRPGKEMKEVVNS